MVDSERVNAPRLPASQEVAGSLKYFAARSIVLLVTLLGCCFEEMAHYTNGRKAAAKMNCESRNSRWEK